MKSYKSEMPELIINYKKSEFKKVKISSSGDCYALLKDLFNPNTIDYFETVQVLYLNKANNTIGWQMVSQGGIDSSIVDIRIILGTALKIGATSIILSHNHPTGRTIPSDSDNKLTIKLKEACKIMEMSLLDHLIITSDNGYYSYADEGII